MCPQANVDDQRTDRWSTEVLHGDPDLTTRTNWFRINEVLTSIRVLPLPAFKSTLAVLGDTRPSL